MRKKGFILKGSINEIIEQLKELQKKYYYVKEVK
ncbi:MAG: Z-ring formation inhibitor MciZ [Candidatus Gastranaerophilales bacterium]|nr:Z-ring formation inhibitor MciZ [Candidatus Gastranaerophilales bacterium]